jgi:Ca-activated chloride channel family protein
VFRFEAPLYLLFLLALPAVAWLRGRGRMEPALRLSRLTDQDAAPSLGARAARRLAALKYLALALMIAAMAGPQSGTAEIRHMTEGINIILAVDVSESMAALDFEREGREVNRLTAVKGVVRDFVGRRRGDRIGLVVFGSEAYTQLPLTMDYQTIVAVLDRLEIGSAGQQTAIGDAVGVGLKRLAEHEDDARVIILLTDGRSNAGELSPQAAQHIAAEAGVKVYTVGVGGTAPARFIIKDPLWGDRAVYRRVEIDEAALREMAEATGGRYFRAQDAEALNRIIAEIDRLEKTKAEVVSYAEYNSLYPWLLGGAFFCLALWMVAANTRLMRVP